MLMLTVMGNEVKESVELIENTTEGENPIRSQDEAMLAEQVKMLLEAMEPAMSVEAVVPTMFKEMFNQKFQEDVIEDESTNQMFQLSPLFWREWMFPLFRPLR